MEANKKSNRRTLIIVLLLFFLPSVAATLLYTSGWRPQGMVNNGELISPVKPIVNIHLQSIDGKAVEFSDLRGKWTMVYFDSSACSEACMKQIFFMRQIHLSKGKDMDRIQRVMILSDSKEIESLGKKLIEYPQMKVLKGDKTTLSLLLNTFEIDEVGDPQRNIYLVDPLGNLMMRYKPGVEPAGMRKDLERLLKYSNEN